MHRPRRFALPVGVIAAAAAAAVAVRHAAHTGRRRPGGILIGDVACYDALSGLVLRGFHSGVASDIAGVAGDGARVLEVGCGPGRLSILLARRHGLDVTGLDLDPRMIERARSNAERSGGGDGRRPSFVVGDVGSLAFADGWFDLVVSTLSMHHWADPAAGLAEIGRVLRPGGRALVWDLRHATTMLHRGPGDPIARAGAAPLRLVDARAWRWPWSIGLTQRIELVRAEGSADHGPHATADPGSRSDRA